MKFRLRILSGLLILCSIGAWWVAATHLDDAHDAAQSGPLRPTSAGATSLPRPGHASLLVVGDSFVISPTDAGADQSYPALVADATGMELLLDGQGGTGFISDARGTGNGDTSRLIDRLNADALKFPDPSVILVDAGRNDLSHPIGEIARAASDYFDRARAHWPKAQIVVLLPSFIRAQPLEGYRELSKAFELITEHVGAMLIDPIAEGWYRGVDTGSLLGEDKVHPNTSGASYIAERIIEWLRSSGLAAEPPHLLPHDAAATEPGR